MLRYKGLGTFSGRVYSVMIFLLVAGVWMTAGQANAQTVQGDYAVYPTLRFRYRHMDVKLKLNPDKAVLKGETTYTLQPYLAGSDEILMRTFRTDIKSVTVAGRRLHYEIHNDTLHIHLPVAYAPDDSFQVHIVFVSQPKFGLHSEGDGTVWTSMLPFTTSHLIPVLDHPRISCPVDLEITVPDSDVVAATGVLNGTVKGKDGWVTTHWQMKKSIPVTNIKFAAGNFNVTRLKKNHLVISLFAGKKMLSGKQQTRLIGLADSLIDKVGNLLHQPYPYTGLNLVVLPDNRWEEKNYAAGFGYLFMDRGSLADQLQRIIYAQWFGANQYSSQYAGAAPQLLMQAWLAAKFEKPYHFHPIPDVNPLHPYSIYDVYGEKNWIRWRLFLQQSSDTVFKKTIDATASRLSSLKGVVNWSDYSRIWYSDSGRLFNLPPLPEPHKPDTLFASLQVTYPQTHLLRIVVDSMRGHRNTLINLPIQMQTISGRVADTLTFAHTGDVAFTKKINGLQNVSIAVPDTAAMIIQQRKPVNFWLYQLYHSKDSRDRVSAARALGRFGKDIDLQLALHDAMSKDSIPEVKAAIIHSMGEIIHGAMGTADDFITYSQSKHPSIKLSAIEVLALYPGNEDAIDAVRSLIRTEHDTNILNTAFTTLQKIDSDSDFQTMIKSYLRKDSTISDTVTATVLSLLTNSHDTLLVDSLAKHYLLDIRPGYHLRLDCLRILGRTDESQPDWISIIPKLIADNDPRIRYLSWQYIDRLPDDQKERLINNQLQEEDDIRVAREIRSLAGVGNR